MWKNFNLYIALVAMGFLPSQIQGIPYRVFKDDHFDATLDFLIVQRKAVKKKTLALDLNKASCICNDDGTVLTSTELMNRFHWEPGVKFDICYTPSDRRSVEVSAAWVAKWHSHAVRTANQSLAFPFESDTYTEDYNSASRVRGSYSSQLWDFEGNYWSHVTPRGEDIFSVSAIAGIRGMYLGEHSRLTYTTPPDTSDYHSRTKNRLCGLQGGLCFQWNPGSHDRWSWELIPKAGILANWAANYVWLGDRNNTTVVRCSEKSKVKETYLLDGDIRFSYHPHRANIHIGYRLIGLWNVALATTQLNESTHFKEASQLRDGNHVFFHIGYIGFGWLF